MLKYQSCQKNQFELLWYLGILGCLGIKHFLRNLSENSYNVSGVLHLCKDAAFAWNKLTCLRVTNIFRFCKCVINYSTLQNIKFAN